jgi:hypothetical protein
MNKTVRFIYIQFLKHKEWERYMVTYGMKDWINNQTKRKS